MLIIGNVNINSLPSKFDQIREIVLKYVDALVIYGNQTQWYFSQRLSFYWLDFLFVVD